MFLSVLTETAQAAPGSSAMGLILSIGLMFVLMYFMIIRPQKKQKAQMAELHKAMEVGDSVMTTSGFYGTIINIADDTIVVEFGNNKNCRIPMNKAAIAEVEKSGVAIEKESE